MLEWAVWSVAIGLFLVTLPGTIELAIITIGALLPGRPSQKASRGSADVKLAAIIPVYNEEAGLARTVRSLGNCDNPLPQSDIIVMACNTTDGTVRVAHELGCRVIERIDPTRRGKGYGLNYAFKQLAGEGYDAYVIIDADTVVDGNFLNEFRTVFAEGKDAGQAILRVANPGSNSSTRLLNIAFLAFTYLRPLARRRLGLSSGIFGNGFGVRASIIAEVPYECFSIAEDLEYHARLVQTGKKVQFLPRTSVQTEMCVSRAQARPQRERWEGGRFRVMWDEGPSLLTSFFSRPRMATLEALLDLALLPLVYHALALCILAVIGSGWLVGYALLSLALMLIHVCQSMSLGHAGVRDWFALTTIPVYLAWKLLNIGRILRAARKTMPWQRTERMVG